MQPMKPFKARRDPAPSKTSYRFQRLWLTPVFRSILRTGVPAFTILAAVVWYLSDDARVDALREHAADLRASVEQRPEFMVNLMRIENVSEEVAEDIREITAVDFPVSSFDLDLALMRANIEELDAVVQASLVVRAGGILDVEVVERVPAIVWRGREALELLDVTGHRVTPIEARGDRQDLQLIAGDGADVVVPEALELLAAAQPISNRIRGLLRVGERRWDLVLDRNQRIMLPEADAVTALERVLALNTINELLSRDLAIVDLRDARRPTLRLGVEAQEFLFQISNDKAKDDA
ncbi:MAG: cell division protein FtsQ/DivIB [Rhodobacterales bacterium]